MSLEKLYVLSYILMLVALIFIGGYLALLPLYHEVWDMLKSSLTK